jgi:glycosyltransferase involved in cell wall biosynthesis
LKRHVLMTTTAYPPSIGGVQGYLADLCAHLERFEPDVVTMWLEHRTDWLLGTTLRLGVPSAQPQGVRHLGWSTGARLRMAPWVLGYYGMVPLAARRIAAAMVPELDRMVTPDDVIVHNHRIGREFLAQASLSIARRRGLPFVLTPYHHPRWRGYRYSGWIEVYRAADAVLTLTQAEAREMGRLGVDAARVHVIGGAADEPMTGDPDRFRATIKTSSRRLVLFLGQLYEYKGVARLLSAAEALHAQDLDFDLVFLGPQTDFSRRLFAQRRPDWVRVLGAVDNQTKWDAIEAATVVCVPSAQESFGRVYLEAWAKGKPVIGGRIPPVMEVVTDGQNGLLVEPTSASHIESALQLLLTDESLAARLGESGRAELAKRFTWKQVAERVEAVYDDLLAKAPTGGADRSES